MKTLAKKSPKKIAIIKLASLGDVIQTTHVLPLIQESGYSIEFFTNATCAPLLKNNPYIEKVHPLPDIGGKPSQSILGIFLLFLKLLFNRYYRVLLFHRQELLSFLIWLSRNKGVGFYHNNKGRFLFKKVFFDIKKHRSELNHALVKEALGISKKNYNFYYFPTKEEILFAKNELPISKKNKLFAINAGGGVNLQSSMPSKRWPVAYYIELLGQVHKNFPEFHFVFFGGPSDEKIHNEILQNLPSTARAFNFTAKKSLRETAALLSFCHIYLGNDSFLLFLAIALKIESTGIFGPTLGKLFMPRLPHAHFIQAKHPLSGCYNPVEKTRGLAYQKEALVILESLKPKTVYQKILPILLK